MNIFLDLFLTFMKIGAFTFGGGYAMISLIEDACVEKKKWLTEEEMVSITVVAESTPGPVAINCSTFVGYKQKGFWGAVIATVGMVLPSFVIIFLISLFLDRFLEITVIANAFHGIKCAVGLLITDAAFRMIKKMKKKPLPIAILICSFVIMMLVNLFAWNFSTIVLMLIGAAVGITASLIAGLHKGKGEKK